MACAADVWYTLPHYPNEASKKCLGSVKFTGRLISAQPRATIIILGAMQTTAGDVLNVHAFLPPPHILFLKTLIHSATQLVSPPGDHPLHKPALHALKRPVRQHRSPLHLLFITTGLKPKPYETIFTTHRRHNYETLASITIDKDRASAIETANNTMGIAIFTDGSGHKLCIGAAAVLIQNGVAK